MRLLNLSTLFIIFLIPLQLSSQIHNWTKSIGSSGQESVSDVVTDGLGNIYTVGYFSTTVDFDPGPGIQNLTSLGSTDGFIQKMDTAGNFIWAKSIGGTGSQLFNDINIDNQGNLYMIGVYEFTVDFDPGPGNFNVTTAGASDNFILKLDSNGIFQWVKTIGGSGSDYCNTFKIDNNNNIYVIGTFSSTVDFDPGVGIVDKTSNGFDDIFILKLDVNGDFIWVNVMGGLGDDGGKTLILEGDSTILVGGDFQYLVDFDAGPATLNFTSTANSADMFIQKLEVTGNHIWTKVLGGSGAEVCHAITTDPLGNIYHTGSFFSTPIDFGDWPNSDLVYSQGGSDIYLNKLNPNGNHIWVKSIGGVNSQYATHLQYLQGGFLLLSGTFYSTVDFDPGPAISEITASGNNDAFIQKLDTTGNSLWVGSISGTMNEGIAKIEIGPEGEMLVVGGYTGTIDTDPGINNNNISSNGTYDFFITKLNYDQCANFSISLNDVNDLGCGNPGMVNTSTIYGIYPVSYSWNTVPISNDSLVNFSTPGIYTLTATDDSLCSAITSILISGPSNLSGVDLNANLITTEFRVGFTAHVWLDGFNDGCTPSSGLMHLIFDDLLNYSSATIPPSSINGDTLTWDFTSITYDSTHIDPVVNFTVDLNAAIGDTICLKTIMTPIVGDSDTTNNIKEYCYEVVNAYDPNDKQVYPQGVCSEHYILNDQTLTYKVRFQNTGNSEAININVMDTISPLLNINSVRIVGSSFEPMMPEILSNNVIKFRFENINLPDSSSNEIASHGYVIFEIDPINNLFNGQIIENKVEIYFDYNPAVVTNTIFNTVMDCSSFYMNANVASNVICEDDTLMATQNPIIGCNSYTWSLDSLYLSSDNFFQWKADTSGVFNLTINKNNNLCTKDSTIQITVLPTIKLLQEIKICQGDSIYLAGDFQQDNGIYIDTLQTINGCDSIVTSNLFSNPLPLITFNQFDPDTLCEHPESILLLIALPLGGYYSGLGVVGDQFDLSSGVGQHIITYTFIDTNNCMNSDSSSITVITCLGLNDLSETDLQFVFPNPTTGKVNIDTSFALLPYAIYTIEGQFVFNGIINEEMDLSAYPDGIYFLQIENARIIKIVKQN